MANNWHDNSPIYKQLEALIISWILKGQYKEGEALPSVRSLSVEYRINHLTAAKSFQNLVEKKIIEKKRGLGMFVCLGATQKLIDAEREKFFDVELCVFMKRAKDLNISKKELIQHIKTWSQSNE